METFTVGNIYNKEVAPPPTPTPIPVPSAVINTRALHMRAGPGTNHDIVAYLSRGERVELLGLRNSDATWVRVRNGEEVRLDYADERGVQLIEIAPTDPLIASTSLQLIIEEVYEGEQYANTCLSEVEVWGRPISE